MKQRSAILKALVVCLVAAAPVSVYAASAVISYGFTNAALSAPTIEQTAATIPTISALTSMSALSPVATSIQQSTDLNPLSSGGGKSGGKKGAGDSKGGGGYSSVRAMSGIDSYFSETTQVYSIPFTYAVTEDFHATFLMPIMSRNDKTSKNTGIGDIVLSAKYRWGEEEKVQVQGLATTKFATGDEQKGLGTGTYDIAATGKVIKRIGDYRFSGAAGLNQPLNDVTINGHKITYGTQFTFMGGAETNMFHPSLWFGLRGQGVSNLYTVVDGSRLNNSLYTFDVVPEVKFFTSYDTALSAGIIAPVYTHYLMPDSKSRDVVFNFGIFKAF